jgi:putative nucleotidyltransferase with HDIG domain
MSLYRIKQFYLAINSKLDNKDFKFIKNNLNLYELKLFHSLSVHEQKHCINVAYDVEKVCREKNINSNILLKASLLHDIGKSINKLTIIDKCFIVILDTITKGHLRKFSNFKKVYVYYNHDKIGYEILKKYEYTYKLLYLIKNHHNDQINGDKELDILKMCDSRN